MAKNQRSTGDAATIRNSLKNTGVSSGRLTGSDEKQGKISRAELTKRIKDRAYVLWQKRGCAHGFDHKDWLEAEAQIKREFRIS